MKRQKLAYLFWYKCSETARTEYIYIVAVSCAQAEYFFMKHFKDYYDYNGRVLSVHPLTMNWEVGTILGDNAIL